MRKLLKIAIISILLIWAFEALYAKKKETISSDEARKAEYLFLEAASKKSGNEIDAYYEFLKRSYELDSTNTAAAFQKGYLDVIMNSRDTTRINKSLAMMAKHIAADPDDYYGSYVYADLCGKLNKFDKSIEVWQRLAKMYPDKPELQYNIADSYVGAGKYGKSIELYDSIESRDGKSLQLTLRKVSAYLQKKDTVNTINEAKRILVSAPANADYNVLVAKVFYEMDRPDSALVYFDRAQQLDPKNGSIYLDKAQFYKAQGDSVNYDAQIYKALMSENLEVSNKVSVLVDYIRGASDGDSIRIDDLFKTLITQHPHEVEIRRLYGIYLNANGVYKNAAEQLSYAVDLDPTNIEDRKRYIVSLVMAEDYKKAIEVADESLKYNDDIDFIMYIASSYNLMKEYTKSISVYQKALEKVDTTVVANMATIYTGLGDTYTAMGDSISAIKNYEKALDAEPGNPMVLNNYAYLLADRDMDLDKAEKMAALAVKFNPDNSANLDTYAWVFFKKRDYKLALLYVKSAIEKSTNASSDILEHYGDILFMSGEPQQAVEQWEKALKLNPNSELLQRKVKHKTYFYK